MQLLFTRSGKIGSRIIRWVLQEPVSHVAILFSSGVVMHATFSGVQMGWVRQFEASHEVVYRVDVPGDDRVELDVMTEMLGKYWGRGYDWQAVLFLGWSGLRRRFLGIPFPEKNKWERPYLLFCGELAETVTGMPVDPMLTAYQLYLQQQLGI